MKITCDTKAMEVSVFKIDEEKKCTGNATASIKFKWDKCTKIEKTRSVKVVAGAQALAATAAAALAVVASQF